METISKFNFLRPDPSRTEIFQYTYNPIEQLTKKEPQLNNEEKSIFLENNKLLGEISKELLEFKDNIKLFISITLKDDEQKETQKLEKTLQAIETNFKELERTFGLKTEQILIFVFMKNIYKTSNIQWLFPGLAHDQITKIEKEKSKILNCNILYKDFKYSSEGSIKNAHLNIIFALQNDITTFSANKALMLGFCKDLHNYSEPDLRHYTQGYFILHLDNGVSPDSNAITNMVLALSYDNTAEINSFNLNQNKKFAVVGNIIPQCVKKDSWFSNIYAKIQQYVYMHDSLYKHYISDLSSRNILNPKFFMIKVNGDNSTMIRKYFYSHDENDIEINDYHNEVLSNELVNKSNLYSSYLPNVIAYVDNTEVTFTDLMKDNTDRTSAEIIIFFYMLKSLFSCNSFRRIFYNFVNIFKLFGLFVSFFLPGLTAFLLYTIFTEAFGVSDNTATYFFTVIYMLFIVLTSMYSMIAKTPADLSFLFKALSYIFLVFYVFGLICACAAINNIRIGKNLNDGLYLFDSGKFIAIIIVNIFLLIIPMLLNFKIYFNEISKAFIYLALGAHNNSSVFLIYSIFNSFKTSSKNNNRKAVFVTVFFILNIFFGYLIFAINSRERRIDSVYVLSLVFTVYNVIKDFLIVLSYVRYYRISLRDMNRFNTEKLKKYFGVKEQRIFVNADNKEASKIDYASTSLLVKQANERKENEERDKVYIDQEEENIIETKREDDEKKLEHSIEDIQDINLDIA